MNSAFTGVSDIQRELMELMSQGLTDKEIASRLELAQSTIRNHRYKLGEKEKQAKLFLAMMDLLSKRTNKNINKLDTDVIYDAHKTATAVDDRYNVSTRKERILLRLILIKGCAEKLSC